MSCPAKQCLGSPAMTLSEYGYQTTYVYMEHHINITISEQNCYNYMIHKYINLIWSLCTKFVGSFVTESLSYHL